MEFEISQIENELVFDAVDDLMTGISFGITIAVLLGC